MKQYIQLLKHVIENGVRKPNRTGVDTLSTFGYSCRFDLRDGFPLLTTKKMPWQSIVIELLWFLSGSNRSDFLERHGVTFWRPWYNPDGTVNAAYGPAWRMFEYPGYYESDSGLSCDDGPCTRYNDQIKWVIRQLKEKPMRRDLVVSAWQPQIAQSKPVTGSYIAPCHCMFVLNVQMTKTGTPVLNLHLTQRSCDTVLGIPFNIASYGLLLSLFARFAKLEAGEMVHSMVDAHIYTCKEDGAMREYDHVPGVLQQIMREPRALPRLEISEQIRGLEDVEALLDPSVSTSEIMRMFKLHGYEPHSKLEFKVAV